MDYLVSGPEMSELDAQTSRDYGLTSRTLMEVAGRAVADVCHALVPAHAKMVVACGPGNNGGDGFVAARALAARGHRVSVFVFAERARLRGDAEAALKTLEKSACCTLTFVKDLRVLVDFASALAAASFAVDALLGTGLHQEVRGIIGDAVAILNDRTCKLISVDIPSGIDSNTGALMGRAVRADYTVTFACAKRGHYLYPGASLRGALTVADIGIPHRLMRDLGVVGRVLLPAHGPALLRERDGDSHKGMFGHVMVVAGNPLSPGAAVLSLQAALRSGAGLVSWATDDSTIARATLRPSEVMLRLPDADHWAEQAWDGASAMVVGPGWSKTPERAAQLKGLLTHATGSMCLDADALNLLAADPSLWDWVRTEVVLTPHPKEMARLIGATVQDVQKDRFASAMRLAVTRKCVVVLKGAGTVVADPDGTAAVIGAGNPGMATGGTGDVLAGIIGGLLAQRYDASTAARAGALLHGVAGDKAALRHGQAGLCAGDVVQSLGEVFAEWKR